MSLARGRDQGPVAILRAPKAGSLGGLLQHERKYIGGASRRGAGYVVS